VLRTLAALFLLPWVVVPTACRQQQDQPASRSTSSTTNANQQAGSDHAPTPPGDTTPPADTAPTGDSPTSGDAPSPGSGMEGGETMPFELTSTAFGAGEVIPRRFTGDGEDVSPALSWAGAPLVTREFALIVDDPDAPTPQPWVHWVIYKIPPTVTGLPENIAKVEAPTAPSGVLQGKNSWHRAGYGGPAPPPGHGVHHYHFKLYALDTPLEAAAGRTKEQLLELMSGHVIATAELIGTYQR
jgi:hypothetical protein